MKVSQLALAVAALAILTGSARAQSYGGGMPPSQGYAASGYYGQAYAMQDPQSYAQESYGQQGYAMQGYPGMQQGAYPAGPMQDAGGDAAQQEQLFGPGAGPMAGPDGQCEQCGPGAAGAECFNDHLDHYAYADIELFYARRTMGLVSSPVIYTTGGTVLETTTSTPDFKYEPGVKGTFGYMFPWAFAVEGSFEGQNYWSSRAGDSLTGSLTIPPPLGQALVDLGSATGGTSTITTSYTSRFDSSEVNFVRPYANIQFLAGVRYLELNEKYDINGASSAVSASDYLVTTQNHLIGPQLGVRGQWQISRLQFDIESKAGIFANSAAEHQTVGDINNTILIRDASANNTELSFVGEVSAYVTYPVFSWLTGKLGYSGIWVSDLALAPNQLDFSNDAGSGTALNAHEGVIIHGFNAGFEARW